ncbi:monovalent cation/H+ antiporter complex subunit F [Acuticoccus sp. M5D2P5]|uniref:monovalent cation/H+ antiporter complex subunit F n=1 Tax=Acuticoccus kalidii TaxID=2910977 RepID=UPI001F3D0C8A|nr:monovalent cation/H+ antiporter complex subunit F [Acuticoccus kalidii]MCF3932804.1 monovalent cation/H+ antiporter complex subunit F [Acuticoccus kalidii]
MIEAIDAHLTTFAFVLIAVLMVPLVLAAVRMIAGPSYADRFIALDMVTAIAVAAAALVTAATGRREFLDVAFGLALVGFLATCAFAGLLERMKGETS